MYVVVRYEKGQLPSAAWAALLRRCRREKKQLLATTLVALYVHILCMFYVYFVCILHVSRAVFYAHTYATFYN